jgi:hypothetical protein
MAPSLAAADYPVTFGNAVNGVRTKSMAPVHEAFLKDATNVGNKDRLLALYEMAGLTRLAGDTKKSIEYFANADALAHEYEGRAVVSAGNVARNVGAALTNEKVMRYEGHGYEKVMSRTLNAINYMNVGDLESALVELRKAEEYQKLERERHEKDVTSAAEEAEKDKEAKAASGHHSNAAVSAKMGEVDALAALVQNSFTYYVSSVIHRAGGPDGLNDAWVDIQKAYELAPESPAVQKSYLTLAKAQGEDTYKLAAEKCGVDLKAQVATEAAAVTPAPAAVVVVKSKIYLIYETGLVPQMQGARIDLLVNGLVLSVAFPFMADMKRPEPALDVTVGDSKSSTAMLVDMRPIVAKSLQECLPGILTRSITGAVAKAAVQKEVQKRTGFLGGLIAKVATAAVTQADLRSWYSLPACVQAAELEVEPGQRDLALDGPGWTERIPVDLKPGKSYFVSIRAFEGHHTVEVKNLEAGKTPTTLAPAAPASTAASTTAAAATNG